MLKFERVARPASPVGVPSAIVPPPAPAFQSGPAADFDPVAVGQEAQKYADQQFTAGRTISASEAVAHVMAQKEAAKRPAPPARPTASDYAAAVRIQTALIERDRAKHRC
jgi:hypothetical protein